MPKLFEYEVTGYGVFPTDMLRYDAAWPATTEDAIAILRGRRELPRDENGNQIPIVIRLHSHSDPTNDRWRSFGWLVHNLSTR